MNDNKMQSSEYFPPEVESDADLEAVSGGDIFFTNVSPSMQSVSNPGVTVNYNTQANVFVLVNANHDPQ